MQNIFDKENLTSDDSYLGEILIVDDNQNIIYVIQSALQGQAVKLTTANTGREALRKLKEQRFDIILLDAKMGDISGFELCRTIKADERFRYSKVIIVNSSSVIEEKVRAYDMGADDYITKPFKSKEFQARIRVMLNLSKAESQLLNRSKQLEELVRVSQFINLRLDLKTIAEEMIKSAFYITKADFVSFFIWDSEKQCHRQLAMHSKEGVTFPELIIPSDRGVSAQIKKEGRLIRIANYSVHPDALPELINLHIYELAGVPVKMGQKHLGTIVVWMGELNKHFIKNDLDILTNLANQVAVAVENVSLYSDLGRKEETYRLITENASDLIISINANGIITFVNERVKALLGIAPDEIIGRGIQHYFTPDAQATLFSLIETYAGELLGADNGFITEEPRELSILNKDGTPINLEFAFGALIQNNVVYGLQGVGRDVSSRKRTEEIERMRVLGQMSSGVAHDFNNVLANVLGHAQLLEQTLESEDAKNTCQIIAQAARDGAETVRRILEFTGQRATQKLDLLDLNQIVQSSIELSRFRWRDDAHLNGMRIEIEREFELIPLVQGKASEIREVIINIINNGIDAMTPQGGKVSFATRQNGKWVELEISDTGKGMSIEVRRHIFEPFFTTKGTRGTGLGLSVAFGIVTRYGGEITCDSTPGNGTTFLIRLPAAGMDLEEAPIVRSTEDDKPGLHKYKGRILAIDDDAGIRKILTRVLETSGFETEVAESGIDALEKLELASKINQDLPYDLILSDLGMPDMGGWEVARAVRTRWDKIPVLLVTGWGEQVDHDKMVEYHVRDIISKPFNISDLLKVIVTYIPQQKS